MSLLAGACLAAASCSDSDKEIKAPSPNFPEAVSPTIGAGETFTIEIDPNQDWEASVPTATAAWFWIEDGTQKVWTLRGGAGPARIVIAAAELEEFDDNRVCEVTLTMGGQSKVIATITRGTLDRGFTLRTCQLDDYGDFIYNPNSTETGLTYLYGTEPAENVALTWPEGRTGFSMPVLVEANFEWVLGKLPEWLEVPAKTIGEPGAQLELRLQGDASRYPLDGAEETLVFTDKNNSGVSYEIPISIPACRDIFSVSGMSAETKFNTKAEYFNSMNGDWVPGSAMGSVQSIDGAKFFLFAEVTQQWGAPYLSAEAEDLAWILLTEEPWDSTPGSDVVQSRQFTVGVTENGGKARKAYLLALPAAVAETISDPYQLIDAEIRDEYKQYLVTTINQEANPGSISANNPAGMTEIGAAFEKLPADDWYIGEFGVRDGYKLIYTKEWSNDPESTLTVDREYTGVAFFDYDLQPMSGEESWLSVRKTAEGVIVDMDPAKDKCGGSSMANEGIAHIGFAVFTDADGRFALIQCIYDENYPIGGGGEGFEVKFAMPESGERRDAGRDHEGELRNGRRRQHGPARLVRREPRHGSSAVHADLHLGRTFERRTGSLALPADHAHADVGRRVARLRTPLRHADSGLHGQTRSGAGFLRHAAVHGRQLEHEMHRLLYARVLNTTHTTGPRSKGRGPVLYDYNLWRIYRTGF